MALTSLDCIHLINISGLIIWLNALDWFHLIEFIWLNSFINIMSLIYMIEFIWLSLLHWLHMIDIIWYSSFNWIHLMTKTTNKMTYQPVRAVLFSWCIVYIFDLPLSNIGQSGHSSAEESQTWKIYPSTLRSLSTHWSPS